MSTITVHQLSDIEPLSCPSIQFNTYLFANMKLISILLPCLLLVACDKDADVPSNTPDDIVAAYRSINSNSSRTADVLMKDSLRVLDIGNSYTTDATAMLPLVFDSLHIDASRMCYYTLVRPSASYKNWLDCYFDADNSEYHFNKVVGGLSSSVKTGKYKAYSGWALRKVLSEKWDLIIIHQYSKYATSYDQWLTVGPYGYLPQLTTLIDSLQPCATLGTYIIHSYASWYNGNNERSSAKRLANIYSAVQRMTTDAPAFQVVVPYGTAVQNLRASYTDPNDMDMTRDGTHLGYGLPRFTASACLFESLFARRFNTSVSNIQVTYQCTKEEHTQSPEGCIDITPDNLPFAISAVQRTMVNP